MVAYFCPLHASYFSTDYVNMQDTYVNMQDNYVNMRDNYVNMQDNYVNMQDTYVNMQDNYVNMRDNYVNMQLIYVNIQIETSTKMYTPFLIGLKLTIWTICAFRVLNPLQWSLAKQCNLKSWKVMTKRCQNKLELKGMV